MSGTKRSGEILSVLRNTPQRWFGISVMGILIAAFIFVLVEDKAGMPVSDQVGFFLVVALPVWVIWRVTCARLVVSTWGLMVVNWFRTSEVPWAAISSIESDDELRILLTDGRTIRPAVGHGSLLGALHGSPAQRKQRELISTLRATADPADTRTTTRLDVGARTVVPIILTGALLTLTMALLRH